MLKKILPIFLLCTVLLVLTPVPAAASLQETKNRRPGPEFSGTDLSGQPVSLAGYQGQPVILRFWSTDCKFCRADTPIFNQYFEKYKEAGLRVVYVNRNSDEATVRQFVADLEIGFPVLIDKDGRFRSGTISRWSRKPLSSAQTTGFLPPSSEGSARLS